MNESLQTLQSYLTQYALAIDEVRLRQDVLDVKPLMVFLFGRFLTSADAIEMQRKVVLSASTPLHSTPVPMGTVCASVPTSMVMVLVRAHIFQCFFVLMHSEHDNLLSWPFKQSVRFTLINQKNPAASITEAFVPDLHSPSFKKPENDMNVASGLPKFARQSVFQDENFTQNNVICIKCQVNLSGLSSNAIVLQFSSFPNICDKICKKGPF